MVYGEGIIRVREFFIDGRPHTPKETSSVSKHAHSYMKKLFSQGFLLRSRDLLSYDFVETHGKTARWTRIRGYLYIQKGSPLLKENNTLEMDFQRTEKHTHETVTERRVIQFINFDEAKVLQKSHYEKEISREKIIKYFKKRGFGANVSAMAEDLKFNPQNLETSLNNLVKKGILARKGKWNPKLGRETLFRGRIHGYVYGLDLDQCKKFIVMGEVLTPEANAILKEVMKNSDEKRLTPLHIFLHSPYNYDSGSLTYSSDILVNTFPSIVKTSSSTGLVFLYDRERLSENDIEKELAFWDRKLSKDKALGNIIGDAHEKIVQKCLDEAGKGLKFDWKFLRVVRGNRISYQIRLGSGHEIDRILLVSTEPLGITHYYPIEAKHRKSGVTLEDVMRFYDVLRRSFEYGCVLDDGYGKETRTIKANVTPIIVTPYILKDAQKWAYEHGMIVLPTWKLTKFLSDKLGIRIDVVKLAKEYVNRKDRNQTLDDFMEERLERG